MPTTEHAVVIAGGGPTGLMLAAELALAHVDVAIVERRAGQDVIGQRAGGLQSRTIEVFDQRGIADRFLAAGQTAQVNGFSWIRLDISDFPTRHPYGLALWQKDIERILAEWVVELGVPTYRGTEVTGFSQDDTGVDVAVSDGRSFRAAYLAGCDGGRSIVRRTAGIEFPGWDPTISSIIGEVRLREEAEWGAKRDARGVHGLSRMDDGDWVRVLVREDELDRDGEPTLDELGAMLVAIYGTDYGLYEARSLSRFTDMTRQAAAYRAGRVLLAGDSAHIHWPIGGQGLNVGVQDAVNLGWKLAQVVSGTSPDSLLDTYHNERHPVGARVLQTTMAQTALIRQDARTDAMRGVLTELLAMEEPRKRIAGEQAELDVHYDFGEGHPLLGRRMPDLDLATSSGPVRVYSLLHDARPVLINLGEPRSPDISARGERVQRIDAAYTGTWELPVLGGVAAPTAVLVRPDGHVAWVGDSGYTGLEEALSTWFGTPTAVV
ncbi:MAG: FAD-dependent monooxygenase [Candidatus Dormibacteraeota bacterium]|nr:FAD-dependent monooxygenase [Candidatus Dormibacteraeota bacterium]